MLSKNLRHEGISWAIIDQAVISGVNLIQGIILVRYLGVAGYGTFVLILMFVQFFSGIQNALISFPMLSISPKLDTPDRLTYFSSVSIWQIILIVVAITILACPLLLPNRFSPEWYNVETFVALASVLFTTQTQDFIRRTFFAKSKPKDAFLFDLTAYGLQIPILFLVLSQDPTPRTGLLAISFSMGLALLFWVKQIEYPYISIRKTISVVSRHWISSKWLLGSSILQWLSGNYLLIITGAVIGTSAVGSIRAAQNIYGVTHVLFRGLENIVPGTASKKLTSIGVNAMEAYLALQASIVLIITGSTVIVAYVFSESLLFLVYGSANPKSIEAMKWFAVIYLLIAIGLPLRSALRALERTRPIFSSYVVGAAFTVTVGPFLVNNWDMTGTLTGILIVQVLSTWVLMRSTFRAINEYQETR